MSYSRCANCGGEQMFNIEKGVLVCERCGSSAPVKEELGKPLQRVYSPTFAYNNIVADRYVCENCGAKVVVGKSGEIKRCASCGNRSVIKVESTSIKAPDGIIPFTLTRKNAAEIFRKWVGSRKFAPSDLKQMAKLEKISGIYVPVWNFNFTTTMRYRALGIKKKIDSEGNSEYIEYPVERIKDESYSNVIRSATTRLSDSFVEDVGAYDFTKLRPYSTDYLLGLSALDTDVGLHSVFEKISNDISYDNEQIAKNNLSVNYHAYENFSCQTRFHNVLFNYAYVPVWANHYTYKGKQYHCYINGQTGKATGKAPKSFAKILSLVLGIAAAVGAIALVVAMLL